MVTDGYVPEKNIREEGKDEMSRNEEMMKMAEEKEMMEEMFILPVGLDEVNTSTRLLNKQYSPMIVRKYQLFGWPMFVGIICDVSLSDLDDVVIKFASIDNPLIKEWVIEHEFYNVVDPDKPIRFITLKDDIQVVRNFCGLLNDYIHKYYSMTKEGSGEGIAVIWYIDKCFISSLWGDFMVHASCKAELFAIINTLPHI